MPERASLVTEEAVRAIMRGQTYRYNPYVTEDDLRVFLQAAEPHLLNAFKERLAALDWREVNAEAEQRCPSRDHRPHACAACVVQAALGTLPSEGEGE